MTDNNIRNISLIFSENPIARAYLYLLIKEKLNFNKIIYLDQKLIFNNFFLRVKYNSVFSKTHKYLKSKNVLNFIRNIENYFNLDKNFLIEMYNFENIFKFKNIYYAKHADINNKNNIDFFKSMEQINFLNSTNKILKEIFNSNKNFFHIHPGYLYEVRGADGTLNSIKYFNEIGVSFYLMNEKIDSGKIINRIKEEFNKLSFPNYNEFNTYDLYNIWFSFFDPALRVSFLQKMIKENIILDKFLVNNQVKENNNYYSFIDKKELRKLFDEKIFK